MICRGFLEVFVASKQVVFLYFSIAKNIKPPVAKSSGLQPKK